MKKLTFGIVASLMLSTIVYFMPGTSKAGANNRMLQTCTLHDAAGNVVSIGNTCTDGGSRCIANPCGGGPQT